MSGTEAAVGKHRIEWVDALRALAMFFVILGHFLGGKTGYFVFTNPIKIPLFFMITGFVFNYGRMGIGDFFKSLFFKLIVPWLCLTVPFVLLSGAIKGASTIPSGLFDIVSGETAWFMPCLIIAEIIWFFICKLGKKPLVTGIGAAAVCVLGIVLHKLGVLGFAMINRAMVVQLYLLFGFLFKLFEERIGRIGWVFIIALAALYIGMLVLQTLLWPGRGFDVHKNAYFNHPYCFATIAIGCFTLFAAAKKLNEQAGAAVPRVIRFLGQTTIVYYLLCSVNITVFTYAVSALNIDLPVWALIILCLVFTYVMCGLEALFLLRFFPWAVGKKRRSTVE
jgi:surface polysaccharide O-acyltransferase-like enzyme